MPKLAIVSTYNENCGNASYTHVLKQAFSKYVSVDVISLDLFLLQSKSPHLVAAGDRHITDICRRLRQYDYVNIQFEGGLYGARIPDVYRRITWLIGAAPNLILTMHRVDTGFARFWDAVKAGFAARSYKRFKSVVGGGAFARLSHRIVQYCAKSARRKNVWIKVHTRREMRSVREIFGNDKVFDYPLTFLTPDERASAWAMANRDAFLDKYDFAPGDKIVGVFGYLSTYKGIETAIEAMGELPSDYKLAIFGSQHPQSVKRNELVNPYIKSLLDLMEAVDKKSSVRLKREARLNVLLKKGQRTKGLPVEGVRSEASTGVRLPGTRVERVSDRVRFIGAVPDPEFIEALRLCDAVALPYVEVGQSMSGVVVLGMESGAKMLCSNNLSFAETRRYYPDAFLTFDVGNPYELAQKIVVCCNDPVAAECRESRMRAFEKYNIDGSVRHQLEKFGFDFAGVQ